jgi:hypothetical protein
MMGQRKKEREKLVELCGKVIGIVRNLLTILFSITTIGAEIGVR